MTRLSWDEVRTRAAKFAREWKDAAYEKEEAQSFYNEFFEIFGVQRRSVARYEQHVAKLDNRHGFIDLFWPGVLLVEQKSAGLDLAKAYDQAGEYFDALEERDKPRYILVSDFQTFELHDLDERQQTAFRLSELQAHVEVFGFIHRVGWRTPRAEAQLSTSTPHQDELWRVNPGAGRTAAWAIIAENSLERARVIFDAHLASPNPIDTNRAAYAFMKRMIDEGEDVEIFMYRLIEMGIDITDSLPELKAEFGNGEDSRS